VGHALHAFTLVGHMSVLFVGQCSLHDLFELACALGGWAIAVLRSAGKMVGLCSIKTHQALVVASETLFRAVTIQVGC
jgi:hypothetical protein